MSVRDRGTGWLDTVSHHRIREVLLHTAFVHRIVCPVYCLMPDHVHLLWMGLRETSDQRLAARTFRRHTAEVVAPLGWQREAYDHVLREQERERGAFQSVAYYIMENPVRAGLTGRAEDHPFTGCMVPGHPAWHPGADGFWPCFWDWYARNSG